MLTDLAAMLVGVAVWDSCWRLGDLRADQELKESGVVFGAAAAGLAFLGSTLLWPPTYAGGAVPALSVLVEWAAPRAVNVMLLVGLGLVAVEYGVVSRVREHDRLLIAPIEQAGDGP